MTDRRSFMLSGSVLLGSTALGRALEAFAAAASPRKPAFFTEPELTTLRALVDVVLPATDSPAASAADTHYFIDIAIPACAAPAAQKVFREGLHALGNGYARFAPDKQVTLLKARAQKDMPLPYDASFFKILKDYTLTGYFLSEIGATQALAYERVPGGYWGDLPLQPNQKAWAI